MKHPLPDEIRLNEAKNALKLQYGNEEKTLPAEFLRVYSPSAEVRGHAPGQTVDRELVGVRRLGDQFIVDR